MRREPGTAEFVASYNEAVARRRAELCDQAMSKLANFRPFEIAEKALTNNVNALERLSDPDPRQAQMHQKLMRALEDLGAGIEATRRMVQERCKMREGGQRNAL